VNKKILERDAGKDIVVVTAYTKETASYGGRKEKIKSLFTTEHEGTGYHYCLFSLFSVFRFLLSFLRADVVHVVKAGPELIVPVLFAKLFRKPVIIKIAQDDLENLLPIKIKILRRARRYLIKNADVIVALSEKIANEARLLGVDGDKIKRIPNGVDIDKFNCNSASQSGVIRNKKYLFVGAISKRKGMLDLLRALEKYEGQNVDFSFAGPIYDIVGFQERLEVLNSKGYIKAKYYGAVNDPEKIIKEHDCLVLPSYNEGMPNVVLEAMACGLYCILSDINVHKELCAAAKGSIFKLGDPDDLLSAIMTFNFMDYGCAERREQSEAAIKRYSSVVVSQMYIDIYNSLCPLTHMGSCS
jgi:Glycosyltransferase